MHQKTNKINKITNTPLNENYGTISDIVEAKFLTLQCTALPDWRLWRVGKPITIRQFIWRGREAQARRRAPKLLKLPTTFLKLKIFKCPLFARRRTARQSMQSVPISSIYDITAVSVNRIITDMTT